MAAGRPSSARQGERPREANTASISTLTFRLQTGREPAPLSKPCSLRDFAMAARANEGRDEDYSSSCTENQQTLRSLAEITRDQGANPALHGPHASALCSNAGLPREDLSHLADCSFRCIWGTGHIYTGLRQEQGTVNAEEAEMRGGPAHGK